MNQPRYAIKVAEIYVRSDKPITHEARTAAINWFFRDPADAIKAGAVVVQVSK